MESRGWWDSAQETALRKQARADVLAALNSAEKAKKPAISEMFTDVFEVSPCTAIA